MKRKPEPKTKQLSLDVPPDLKRALKARAAMLDISLNQMVVNILMADMERKGA